MDAFGTSAEDDLVEILGYDQKIVIYRVIQESLTNAARYSRATKIRITMQCQSDDLSLEVSDDGVGFDVERQNQEQDLVKNHLGILGMRERVKIVNGRFAIESTIGGGTRIRVSVPFNDRIVDQQTGVAGKVEVVPVRLRICEPVYPP